MVTAQQLAARRETIAGSVELTALARHLGTRNARVIERLPPIPDVKALLSVDGGRCPADGSALVFDPWSPAEHACPSCGKRYRGERHHRAWAKYQHLWLAERAVELAALAALSPGAGNAAARSAEILRDYGERYFTYPNRDNVLGPSRLFFSTYLESIWILNYLAAATLLRETERLDEETAQAVHSVADEAANLIGEFDEGFSNRQTWNNAALCAIAVWFEDEGLAHRALQGGTGLVAHLRGYRDDGMWYEGENYHLFALRGLLTGAAWAEEAGMDFFGEEALAACLTRALRAPSLTALPDFTFPARKDARFGVSLAQPMYLELWEVGLGRLGSGEGVAPSGELATWLRALYDAPPQRLEAFESYLHDAPVEPHPTPHSRSRLSWWSLLAMLPELPSSPQSAWSPPSVFLEGQGLAVLRIGGRYTGLECGAVGGGHGHADRLNLMMHGDGVHWLPDVGTGSYVEGHLFWYRSTLAHNAPRVDGVSQPFRDAHGEGFDVQPGWGWVRGRFGALTRTVVVGEQYLIDVVELTDREEHTLELPWHFGGTGDVATPGRWEDGELAGEFVTKVERFAGGSAGPIDLELTADRRLLTAHFLYDGELLRAEGPGRPNSGRRERFYVLRGRGRNLRFVTVLEFGPRGSVARAVRARGELVEVERPTGLDRHRFTGREWEIQSAGARVVLTATTTPPSPGDTLLDLEPPVRPTGTALRCQAPPPLNGSLDGFDTSEPLRLELEDQYRRSEEPYSAEDFSAVCYANWDDDALYLGVQVIKPDLCLRVADAPPLLLDNEPDDIHSDGLQVYLGEVEEADSSPTGFLIVPERGVSGLRVRTAGGATGDPRSVRGAWRSTADGYVVTAAIAWPERLVTHAGGRVAFDLLVNEMLPGRERRAGQLVWSGGNGWVWLRGDRQEPRRFGVLELIG